MLRFLPQPAETDNDEPVHPAQPTPKLSEHKPKEFLLNIAKRIRTENESDRAKEQAQTIYSMCRRHRGQSFADLFGYFRSGVWCESPLFSQLHGTNVFQSLIRGAEANFNQADISLEIRANRNTPQTRSAVRIARKIYEVLKERQLTETVRQQIFYANILMLNAFFISRFDKAKGLEIPTPNFEQVDYEEGGTYVCPQCYASGQFSTVTEDFVCPECGNQSLSVIDEPVQTRDYLVDKFDKQKAGETELVIADGLDVSTDPNGKPCDVKSCAWIEWRYLAQKNELKRLYPHLQLESKCDWSYQTRLKIGLKRYASGESYPETDFDKTTYEVRQIWLDLTEYEDYIPPIDFTVGNFTFRRGVPLKTQCPDGLVFGVVSGELAFIDAENKNKRVAASLWLSDGVSFAGLGAKAGLLIQKKINHLDNMAMEGEARSLKGSVVYDTEAVDGSNLEGANTNIPLRQDYANDRGISHAVMPLKVEGLSQESLIYLAAQKQVMQEVMGVPDVALGQDTAEDPTYGGQALRARKASSLLIPALQSVARAIELWFGHQLDLVQNFYAPEALYQFGVGHGEEWQPEEIEAFFSCDFERDTTIFYLPGSEVAESRFEKQQRLRADIAAQFIPLTPELQAQIARESGYEVDVNNFDSNQKLAESRWNFITEQIGQMPDLELAFKQAEQMLVDPNTFIRLTDETGNPVPNPIVHQILGAPDLNLYKEVENHPQMVEYWGDKVRTLAASSQRSDLLIALAAGMIAKHNSAIFELSMKQQTLESLAAMPTMMGQKMLTEGDREAEQESKQAETEGSRQHEKEMKMMDHQFEKEMAEAAV